MAHPSDTAVVEAALTLINAAVGPGATVCHSEGEDPVPAESSHWTATDSSAPHDHSATTEVGGTVCHPEADPAPVEAYHWTAAASSAPHGKSATTKVGGSDASSRSARSDRAVACGAHIAAVRATTALLLHSHLAPGHDTSHSLVHDTSDCWSRLSPLEQRQRQYQQVQTLNPTPFSPDLTQAVHRLYTPNPEP